MCTYLIKAWADERAGVSLDKDVHVSVRWVCAGTSDKIVCCNCNNALVQKQDLFPRNPLFLHATSLVNKEVKFLNRPVDGDYQSSERQKERERGEVIERCDMARE